MLKVDHPDGQAPLVDIFGGKITTYRRLSEHMLEKIGHLLDKKGKSWTADAPLPGGDFPATGFDGQVRRLRDDYPFLDERFARRLTRLYGTRARKVLGSSTSLDQLGRRFGADLYEAEIRYLMEQEWAATAEDVLWRRTKRGLVLSPQEADELDRFMKENGRGLQNAAAE